MAQLQSIRSDRNQVGFPRLQSHPRAIFGLALAALGAISFWLPDVVIHADAGPNLDARHAWAITLLGPAIFLVAYLGARRFALKRGFAKVGLTMLMGVWLSGGLFMTAAAILSRSEFIGGTGVWRLVAIFMSVIPIVAFILASYDGSVFGLLAITMGGLVILGVRASIALWSSGATVNRIAVKSPSHGGRSNAA